MLLFHFFYCLGSWKPLVWQGPLLFAFVTLSTLPVYGKKKLGNGISAFSVDWEKRGEMHLLLQAIHDSLTTSYLREAFGSTGAPLEERHRSSFLTVMADGLRAGGNRVFVSVEGEVGICRCLFFS